ncbi:MAG: prenyltransferase/squalene oxidase repeat-containing protein [Planctomycetota bacterium]|jgi:hypothetical protein
MSGGIVDHLLKSDEPCVRYKVRVNVLGEDADSRAIKRLRTQIRKSSRVQALMSEATEDGPPPHHPYGKWYGAHWIMASLADIGHPPGDRRLIPWRERVYAWHFGRGSRKAIPCVEGRYRRCASQEGNTVHYLLALGLPDERTDELVRRLIKWQWPDGGWNCDKKPEAVNSSFHESLIPLRALSLHARVTGDKRSAAAARRAARIFLKRRMFRRQRDGQIMNGDFVTLHYPCYWHYDVLSGLKVMAEARLIGDRRCQEALDWLESKQLPGGGWRAEAKYWRVSKQRKAGTDLVSWGPTGTTRVNEFVTADALFVLRAAGRLHV